MRHTKFQISFILIFLFASTLLAAISPQSLYDTLLTTKLTNLPAGSAAPTISAVTFNEQNKGPLGGVQVEFPGKTGIVYLVFSDREGASEYNRKHLPPKIPGEKLHPYPPMSRCALGPNGGGYCDLWIQDYNVIMIAAGSNVDDAARFMDIGFKHLTNIVEHAPLPPPSGTGTCSLLSKQEVESALNQSIREPEPDRVGGCFFGSKSGADGVTIQAPGTGKAGFDAKKNRMGTTSIPGIGDESFGGASLAGFVEIHLVKNGKYMVLIYQNQRDSSKMETAKHLAQLLAGRL